MRGKYYFPLIFSEPLTIGAQSVAKDRFLTLVNTVSMFTFDTGMKLFASYCWRCLSDCLKLMAAPRSYQLGWDF